MSQSAVPQPDHAVLSTMNVDGSRRWLRPRVSPGRFLTARRIVGYALIAVFAAIPYIRINGKPAMLLDIPARQFTFFGKTFLPTDTVLLALFMVGLIVGIFLITAIVGRVWCGWACPQTVYMELVYRPLERLFDGPPGSSRHHRQRRSPARTVLKYAVYLLVSMFLAHVFLAYFVGIDRLSTWVRSSPVEHPLAFFVMALTTGLMMFDFCYFREQTCILACPYGRFQSVLLDRDSLIISYDERRGEPRGKPGREGVGDCVDCRLCVTTCPTGIDIRDGLQMECIACAQCIDACDAVMDRLGRPRGLIRYSSQNRIAGVPQKRLRPRLVFYPLILAIIGVLFFTVLESKGTADVTVMRGMGNPFTRLESGEIANPVVVKITNRSDRPAVFEVEVVEDLPVRLISDELPVEVVPGETRSVHLLVASGPEVFVHGKRDITLRIRAGGFAAEKQYRLLGPAAAAGAPTTP